AGAAAAIAPGDGRRVRVEHAGIGERARERYGLSLRSSQISRGRDGRRHIPDVDVHLVPSVVAAILVGGPGRDRVVVGPVDVGVPERGRVAGDGFRLAISPGDGPGGDGVLSRVAGREL